MIYILYLGLIYLLATTIVLIRNLFEFEGLKDVTPTPTENPPFVSICVPARNEEAVIERCVISALKQNYEYFEVLVLDDSSTDNTSEILSKLSGIIHNLKHIKGSPKPDDWLGKPWACHQLSKAAQGDVLLFIDADVWMEPDAIPNAVELLKTRDAITVWPQQKLGSFWENMIIPLIYFALFTLLPATYVERSPRWIPRFLKPTLDSKFVVGCGQFFALNRNSYDSIQGHESVKNKVVEDMELARNLKSSSLSIKMLHGVDSVHCRMYKNHTEIWNGFKKNFLAGFGNIFEFLLMGVVHFLVFLFPIYSLMIGLITDQLILSILSISSLTIITIQHLLLSLKFKWNISFSFLHPISVIWFQLLGIVSIVNKALGRKNNWKGREV